LVLATLTITTAFLIPFWYSKNEGCAQGYPYLTSWVNTVYPSYFECSDRFNPVTNSYDYYSPLGTVLINTNSIVLADFSATYQLSAFSLPGVNLSSLQMFLFIVFWVLFTSLTYGTSIPTGLFQPCIVIGFAIGSLYQNIAITYLAVADSNVSVFPLLFAAAAMTTSVTGLFYSIIVLFLEESNSFNITIPMVACVFIARGISSYLTKSTY